MITAAVIFGVCYLGIASGKVPISLVALIGAATMVLLGVVTSEQAFSHVDLNVIFLLAGMMVLADIVARTGAFEWASIRGAQLVRGDGFLILCLLSLITAVASAFLDNVTTVVFMVPVTLSVCRSVNLDPVPFLIAEVFASNIGGTATLIGDPPNIIIGSAADIGFTEFLVNMAPVSLLSTGLLLVLLFLWFRRHVRIPEGQRLEILRRSPGDAIRDFGLLWKSMAVMALTIVGFLIHGLIHVSPAFIAISGAALLVLISRLDPREVLHGVEWTTLTFFVGLFVMVGALVETGVTDQLREWMVQLAGGSDRNLSLILVWVGGGASSIVDNIPYTATMTSVVKQLAVESGGQGTSPLWWALALGADLGGNMTIIGASANVVVVSLARAQGHPIGFMQFMKYGAVITVGALLVSSVFLWLRFYL